DGGAAGNERFPLPCLPRRGRAGVPRLPGLHDEAEAGLRQLQGPARAALAGLPLLRDADRAALARVRRADLPAHPPRAVAPASRRRRPRARPGREPDGRSVDSPAMPVERTLVLIKPDAVKRGLAGEILGRFEARGLVMRAGRLLTVDRALAEQHYAEHAEKPFFGELVDFITSTPTLALVLEGEGAIAVVRSTMGSTNPADSAPGTIRGDLALSMPDNLVHGSDSPESAAREVSLWFGDDHT